MDEGSAIGGLLGVRSPQGTLLFEARTDVRRERRTPDALGA